MLIDTHSHLNFKAYDNDRDEVIKRTQKEGIICIDIGTKYETSERAVKLAENNKNIFAAIGMHPFHIKTDLLKIKTDKEEGSFTPLGEELNIYRYEKLARSKKVIAIGEIGLDYYYKPKTKKKLEEFKKLQKDVFVKQLDLAKDLNLPVIIHCRAAFNDIYEILKNKKLRGVIHCFVGTVEEMKKIVDLGFYIGLNGIIFKLDLDKVIKECPLDKILIETDCPYLTPPKAGTERNEPVFVKYVAERIAELKNISFNQVTEQTTKNSKKLFNI